MSHQPLISVIVPVYNVENYVGACIDSITEQSYDNLEIILIDDGSTDNSGAICDQYSNRDNRIKVIHQQNGGLSMARNTGLDVLRGEYVTFVDSDDLIHREAIATMWKQLISNDADISTISFTTFKESGTPPSKAPLGARFIMNGHHAVKSMLYQRKIDNSAWGKLFKASLFASHRFPAGMLYEDLATIPLVCLDANRVAINTTGMYFYRNRATSIIGTFTLRRADVLDVTDRLVDYFSANNTSILHAAKSRKFSANMNILWLMTVTGIGNEELTTRCWNNIKQLRWEILLNPCVRLKNKCGAIASFTGLNHLMTILNRFKD